MSFDESTSVGPRSGSTSTSTSCPRARGRGPAARATCADQGLERGPISSSRVWPNSSVLDELEHPLDRAGQPLRGGADPIDPAAPPARRSRPGDIFQSSVSPRTTATGVFSSWLATSRKAVFRRLASTSLALVGLQLGHQPVLLDDQVVLLDGLADRRPPARPAPRAW